MCRRSPKTQIVSGASLVVLALLLTPLFQSSFSADGLGLSQYWWPDTHPYFDQAPIPDNHPTGYFIVTISLRAAGTVLIGSALYRYGIIQGNRDRAFYRKLATLGFATGIPLATTSVVWMYVADYDPSIAFLGHIPNVASAIPIALGYIAIIALWGKNDSSGRSDLVRNGLQAVGRMALTNSILYVTVGLLVIREGFGQNYFTRWELALVVALVWFAQLAWSTLWLRQFNYGPFEWLLRVITYRQWVPLKHRPTIPC